MPRSELEIYRFLTELRAQLERVRDADKAVKIALRLAREFFGAKAACVARLRAGIRRPELVVRAPQDANWNLPLLKRFLAGERPRLPRNMLVAPLVRRERTWAALALRRGEDYGIDDVRAVGRVAGTVSSLIQSIDQARLVDVRSRIERKMLEQLRPKDLFYQILHGLRSLTRYDHSAAVLIHEPDVASLEVVAEQIAWRKGKSPNVGKRMRVTGELRGAMEGGGVHGFNRSGGRWRPWKADHSASLAAALDYNTKSDERSEMSLLCAPLATNDGALGMLKIASCHPDALGRYEAEAIARFLPHVAMAVRNLMRNRTLELGVLEAERKHVMANLARGVSHDVNNALGSVLPLVQQMRTELDGGRSDPEVMSVDLEQIEQSLKACQRIFGGMLSFARGSGREVGSGDLRKALESTFAILNDSLRRQGVHVDLEVPAKLPLVRGGQGDLEQLVLNLATNARDAMPTGGRLCIAVVHERADLIVTVADDGVGIEPETRARVLEPFFTTKPHGNGLGLSICRSIVWNMGGKLSIESEPGDGTRVLMRLPKADESRSR
ncbi:MAG: HAMP domain-containing histidine kinase [bacterium]|nr:HAMP domain-containing histidine kinase [bacterium]